MKILGIETSCDETGVAVYDGNADCLLADALFSQAELHALFGGVVPELASRDHIRRLLPLIRQVLQQARLSVGDLAGIAYTQGPGLAGALLVGATVAKSLSFAWGIPSLGIHHMEGHLLAPMLADSPPTFPFLGLLVSGGHSLLVAVHGIGRYRLLGESLDDAVGEAFDKTATLLGLPYPGGPALEQLALQGDPQRFTLPRPMLGRPELNFSFSGLKTAVAQLWRSCEQTSQDAADIAAAFQQAAIASLVGKTKQAIQHSGLTRVVISGGVSANRALRQAFDSLAAEVFFPAIQFSTDNGAMIAYAGYQRLSLGQYDRSNVITIQPRWSLADLLPPPGLT